jgi:hypothetical protein
MAGIMALQLRMLQVLSHYDVPSLGPREKDQLVAWDDRSCIPGGCCDKHGKLALWSGQCWHLVDAGFRRGATYAIGKSLSSISEAGGTLLTGRSPKYSDNSLKKRASQARQNQADDHRVGLE